MRSSDAALHGYTATMAAGHRLLHWVFSYLLPSSYATRRRSAKPRRLVTHRSLSWEVDTHRLRWCTRRPPDRLDSLGSASHGSAWRRIQEHPKRRRIVSSPHYLDKWSPRVDVQHVTARHDLALWSAVPSYIEQEQSDPSDVYWHSDDSWPNVSCAKRSVGRTGRGGAGRSGAGRHIDATSAPSRAETGSMRFHRIQWKNTGAKRQTTVLE